MVRAVALGIVFSICATVAYAADSATDAAMAALKAKQAAREQERSKTVEITAGELEDLRMQVKRLEAENGLLHKQLADAGSKSQTVHKRYTKIELGMTRGELDAFLQQHKNEFRILGMTADAGVAKRTIKTTVDRQDAQTINRQSQTNTNTVVNNSNPQYKGVGEEQGSQVNAGTIVKQNVQQEVNTGQKETIRVGVLEKVSVQNGSHTDVLGHSVADYGVDYRVKSIFAVELTDGVVTSVVASAM